MQPSSEGGNKVDIFRPGHMTKMAAMLYMVKTLKNFHQNHRADCLETSNVSCRELFILIYINDDPELIFTNLMVKSNCVP